MYKTCNVVQSVDHVLLYCKGSNLTTNRIIFEDKLSKYAPNYRSLSDEDKLQMVRNFKPLWKKEDENEARKTICIPSSECTGHDFLHFCDMNVLLIQVNKRTYLLTYLLTYYKIDLDGKKLRSGHPPDGLIISERLSYKILLIFPYFSADLQAKYT